MIALVEVGHDRREEGRVAGAAQLLDGQGGVFVVVGGRPQASLEQVDRALAAFARQVAQYLNNAIAESRVNKLVILAAPEFLGYLRAELSNTALESIALAEARNVSDLDDEDIKRYFE